MRHPLVPVERFRDIRLHHLFEGRGAEISRERHRHCPMRKGERVLSIGGGEDRSEVASVQNLVRLCVEHVIESAAPVYGTVFEFENSLIIDPGWLKKEERKEGIPKNPTYKFTFMVLASGSYKKFIQNDFYGLYKKSSMKTWETL